MEEIDGDVGLVVGLPVEVLDVDALLVLEAMCWLKMLTKSP